MPFRLELSSVASQEGWSVKIQDKERLEPPHATVRRRTMAWRWDLRARCFMDAEPDPGAIPAEVTALLTAEHERLVGAWDRIHPGNPVNGAN